MKQEFYEKLSKIVRKEQILELSQEENVYTGEKIYIMTLECNNMVFTMAVNSGNLLGEPEVGRRFKGQIWLQGSIKFSK